MRRAALVALVALGCAGRSNTSRPSGVSDPFSGENGDETPVLRRELEAEVLESYERDEVSASDDWQGVIDPALGIVRFGVGPEDQAVVTKGGAPGRALPLGLRAGADDADNAACPETLRSKHLEIHLSQDASTAWIADELTACVSVCGKQALLPLRLSAVYVRGGDRWVLAVEHLSYPQTAAALIARGEAHARPLDPAVSARASGDEVAAAVARAVAAIEKLDRSAEFSTAPGSLVWWPDPAHELREAAIVSGPSLTDAFDAAAITAEGARIGIGATSGQGAIAWWSGTLLVRARRAAAGSAATEVPVRLRATFVLQRDVDRWRIVQAHVSAPIDDATLAKQIAGAATIAGGRVVLDCATPAAGPRTAVDGGATPAPAPPPSTPAARSR